MNNTSNQKPEERKSQPAQVTQSGSGSTDKQMGDSSGNRDSSTQPGKSAGQATPAQPQQQHKFTRQHDAGKGKTAPQVDKGANESHKDQSRKKDSKAC